MEVLESNYIPLSYLYSSRYGESRASVPVLQSQVLYANFAHVAGVAAPSGTPAYSVDKLQILDTLIGRLQSIKSDPLAAAETSPGMSAGRIDALIQQYGSEIHQLATAPAMPYAPAAMSIAEPGMLFSMAA
jgi:hypothetical protein